METEEQRVAREAADALKLLGWRARAALREAPDQIMRVRAIAIGGGSERGETLPEWTSPKRITAADDADEAYAQIVNWVGQWAEVLEVAPPALSVVVWSNQREPQGFRLSTTPEGAHMLAQRRTMWLLLKGGRIGDHTSAEPYFRDIVDVLGKLRVGIH